MVNGNATRNLLEVQELGILPSLLTLGRLEASFRLLSLNRSFEIIVMINFGSFILQ